MGDFIDNFSKQSDTYRKYRPTYPDELFSFLHSLTQNHQLAWDCGTGNGQAAISLAPYYDAVYATDPSEQQIMHATPHPKITYATEKAELCTLPSHSVDIITVALAIHWFDFDAFYTQAKRVLKPNGVIAAWAYSLPFVTLEIDALVQYFHDEVVGEFWQPENKLIEKEYTTIPFPFEPIPTPAFQMHKMLDAVDLIGLLNSWSTVPKYINKYGNNPVDRIEEKLLTLWGPRKRETSWKMYLKVGRNLSTT